MTMNSTNCSECDSTAPNHQRWCIFYERPPKPKRKKGEPVPLAERAQDLADPDRRGWVRSSDLAAELADAVEWARELADAIESLQDAVERKESADDMTGQEKSEELADAWECAVESLQTIADNLSNLESSL